MAYESIPEIFDSINETRARLIDRMSSLSAEQESTRPNADGWTVAEIVEHLGMVERQIAKLTTLMLMKAETGGAPAREDGLIEPVSMDHIIERSSREKYQAPETARPRGGVPVADSLALMRATRESLNDLRPRLAATNLASVRYPHPVFGPLNLYEWLIMIGFHEDRHLRQIEAMLAEPVST